MIREMITRHFQEPLLVDFSTYSPFTADLLTAATFFFYHLGNRAALSPVQTNPVKVSEVQYVIYLCQTTAG